MEMEKEIMAEWVPTDFAGGTTTISCSQCGYEIVFSRLPPSRCAGCGSKMEVRVFTAPPYPGTGV